MSVEDAFIDLKSVPCPINFVRAKLMIDSMKHGEVLRIELDDGEPVESVTKSMQEEGHELIQQNKFEEHHELFVKKV